MRILISSVKVADCPPMGQTSLCKRIMSIRKFIHFPFLVLRAGFGVWLYQFLFRTLFYVRLFFDFKNNPFSILSTPKML